MLDPVTRDAMSNLESRWERCHEKNVELTRDRDRLKLLLTAEAKLTAKVCGENAELETRAGKLERSASVRWFLLVIVSTALIIITVIALLRPRPPRLGSWCLLALLALTSTAGAAEPAELLRSTVRIRSITGNQTEVGSGTVIGSRDGELQILTCAHQFETKPDSINVDFYAGSRMETREGRLVSTGKHDVALVAARAPRLAVPVALVASAEHLAPGDPVHSVGCSLGRPPTVERTTILARDLFGGYANLDTKKPPQEGRSGGGLFNDRGELVGVCHGVNPVEGGGIYVGLREIRGVLHTVSYAPSVDAPKGIAVSPLSALTIKTGRAMNVGSLQTGDLHPTLQKLCQDYADRMAAQGRQDGHAGWDSRKAVAANAIPQCRSFAENTTESLAGKTPEQHAFEMFNSWRQSPGHWRAANSPCDYCGYAMSQGRNGVCYGAAIMAWKGRQP